MIDSMTALLLLSEEDRPRDSLQSVPGHSGSATEILYGMRHQQTPEPSEETGVTRIALAVDPGVAVGKQAGQFADVELYPEVG